jgi:hypothetical protein
MCWGFSFGFGFEGLIGLFWEILGGLVIGYFVT